jgi:hypothetical protein
MISVAPVRGNFVAAPADWNARQRRGARQDLAKEREAHLWILVTRSGKVGLGDEHISRLEALIDGRDMEETGQQQSGANQQHHAHTDFARNEPCSEPTHSATDGRAVAAILESLGRIGAGEPPRGRQSTEHGTQQSDHQCE